MYIKARDEDKPIGRDDDLDDIYINRSRQPNPGYSQVADYLGNNGKVSVRLRYRISCQTNYYGTNCATSCVARNDDVNGHYTCNSDGSIRCRDGYENPSNNCRDSKLQVSLLKILALDYWNSDIRCLIDYWNSDIACLFLTPR